MLTTTDLPKRTMTNNDQKHKLLTSSDFVYIQALKDALTGQGIQSHIITDTSPCSNGAGDFTTYSLYVPAGYTDKARQVLDTIKTRDDDNSALWCEHCGSENIIRQVIHKRRAPKWFLWGGLFFIFFSLASLVVTLVMPGGIFLFLPFLGIVFIWVYFRGHTQEIYTCNDCHKQFRRN